MQVNLLFNNLRWLQFCNQQIIDSVSNINTQLDILCNHLFANNYDNILKCCSDLDVNILDKLNNVLNFQPFKSYISQVRIRNRLNNAIHEIKQNLDNTIPQQDLHYNQLYN